MDPERWREIRSVFDRARELEGEECIRFVAEECGDDLDLRREVESLLAASDSAETFLDRPFARLSPGTPSQTREIESVGPWAIERLLGRGGMGSVYLAVRADEAYRGKVAVKVLRSDLTNEDLIRRFRSERQILADLRHPNIARLLDGGSTEDGRPYLVMEYVKGRPIDRYCDEHELSVADRLRLFQKICSAVHSAHRNLVVHRDIKPANILVDEHGEPRLLDFGIAKLSKPEGMLGAGMETAPGLTPMTLEYASPEQLGSRSVTTASDIYSLGVLLYELLAGARPHEVAGRTPYEFVRTVCETEAMPPSESIARSSSERREEVAQARSTDPRALVRRLSGDLDTIVLLALSSEVERRYASAAELSRDIERHLKGEPVRARPATWHYKTGKLIRRHPWGAAAAVAVFCGLIVFTAALYVQNRLALQQKALAEESRNLLTDLFSLADPQFLYRDGSLNLPPGSAREMTLREALGASAAELPVRGSDQPELEAELTATLAQAYIALGLYSDARPLVERAIDLRTSVRGEPLAEDVLRLADLQMGEGSLDGALADYQRALDLAEKEGRLNTEVAEKGLAGLGTVQARLGDNDAASVTRNRSLRLAQDLYGDRSPRVALNLRALGDLLWQRQEFDEAADHFDRALSILRTAHHPLHPEIASTIHRRGMLLNEHGDLNEAEANLREALELRREAVGAPHPLIADTLFGLALVLSRRGQLDEAEELCREALEDLVSLYGEESIHSGFLLNLLGTIHRMRGDSAEALDYHQQALAIWVPQRGRDHPLVAAAENNIGLVLDQEGRGEEAEPHYRESLRSYRAVYGDEPHSRVGIVLNNLAFNYKRRELNDRVEPLYREALEIFLDVHQGENLEAATTQSNLATLLLEEGDPHAAEELYRAAITTFRNLLGEEHLNVAVTLNNLARSLRDMGDLDAAERAAHQALAIYDGKSGIESLVSKVETTLGEILTSRGQWDAAESKLSAALQTCLAANPANEDACERTRESLVELSESRAPIAPAEAASG